MELEEEIQFEKLLAEKRHKEIKDALRGVISSVNQKDIGLKEAIDKYSGAIDGFVETIKNLQKQPEVKVETNQQLVVDSVKRVGEELLKGIDELKKCVEQKPVVDKYEFNFVRGKFSELIEKATIAVIYK